MSEILRAPNPRNPRVITDERIETLTKALATFGDLGGIVYNTRSKQTVGGHQRLRSFQSDDKAKIELTKTLKEPDAQGTTAYGWVVANGTRYAYREVDWPVDVETAAMLAANKFSGEWDNTALEPLLVELNTGGFDMELTGFDIGDLADFKGFQPPESDAEPQISKADELQKKWGTKTGQLWKIGEHRLLCGDSTKAEDVERVMGGEKAALCLTDPPYGVSMDKGFVGFGGFGKPIARRTYSDQWDKDRPAASAFELMQSNSELCIVWGGNFFADILPRSSHWLVWDKKQTMPTFGDCELAWTNSDRKSVKKYEVEYNGLIGKEKERFHPTQKPVVLMNAVAGDYSETGATVLDPFLGSGTTMVACENLGRKCRGIEISPGYVAVILERMVTAFPHLTPEISE